MVVYVFFMLWRIVVACNEAGCSVSSPDKLALIAIAGGIELIFEIKGVIGIYKGKGRDG
jgi:hypothetical protein